MTEVGLSVVGAKSQDLLASADSVLTSFDPPLIGPSASWKGNIKLLERLFKGLMKPQLERV